MKVGKGERVTLNEGRGCQWSGKREGMESTEDSRGFKEGWGQGIRRRRYRRGSTIVWSNSCWSEGDF